MLCIRLAALAAVPVGDNRFLCYTGTLLADDVRQHPEEGSRDDRPWRGGGAEPPTVPLHRHYFDQ